MRRNKNDDTSPGHDSPGHDSPGHDSPGHDSPGRDRLGMDQPITRRDFINGMAVAATTALPISQAFAPQAFAQGALPTDSTALAAQDAPDYYPPHAHRHAGQPRPVPSKRPTPCAMAARQPAPIDSGEEYDLIVVGAGISGLSAAHFYRAGKPRGKARILLLDNHDDFGGHAKRNEFHLGQCNCT